MSALLFILVAEILATKVRLSNDVKGITFLVSTNKVRHLKITQLADDTTLFLGKLLDIPKAMDLIEEFGVHSVHKLNKDKTERLLIGKLKSNTEQIHHKITFKTTTKA